MSSARRGVSRCPAARTEPQPSSPGTNSSLPQSITAQAIAAPALQHHEKLNAHAFKSLLINTNSGHLSLPSHHFSNRRYHLPLILFKK